MQAGVGEVGEHGRAAMLLGNDVLNLERTGVERRVPCFRGHRKLSSVHRSGTGRESMGVGADELLILSRQLD